MWQHCPRCGSENTRGIGISSFAKNTLMLGPFGPLRWFRMRFLWGTNMTCRACNNKWRYKKVRRATG